ncbi:SERTA domain-containing protein 3 [Osmerus mordax]|uniref:SERTA domain-containing protein 3 n=1 Tax=Osmerus mordax TaxID=8014 RepID=UPI00350EC857
MIAKGMKRKFQEDDAQCGSVNGVRWENQRQSVLDISLVKYQHGQELVEPSLRRSVLIANTLRQVTQETKRPVEVVLKATPVSPTAPSSTTESLPSRVSVANCHSRVEEDWVAMTAEPDFSMSGAISSILKELDTTLDGVFGPQSGPRLPLRSLENLSGPGQGVWEGRRAEVSRGWEGVNWGTAEVMASGYLQDVTLDDIFQDIDTSTLEKEMGALGVRAPSSTSSSSFSSSCPFSQELLRCLPSLASSSPFFPSSSSSLFSHNQSPRELSELDHLMEILVES